MKKLLIVMFLASPLLSSQKDCKPTIEVKVAISDVTPRTSIMKKYMEQEAKTNTLYLSKQELEAISKIQIKERK
jgi:ssRNA-specific RNase YbeY (16S rRNA maturation enzyme)